MVAVEEVSKSDLRKYALNRRIFIKNKLLKEDIITKKLLENAIIKNSSNVLIYMSTKSEVSTSNILNELLKLKKNIYIPKVEGKKIEFYKFTSISDLVLGNFNILEPIPVNKLKNFKSSVIVVPGLLFDKVGNRLGYGGGYYDRYLENKNIYKIGICFKEFLIDKLNVNNYDIKMDEVITDE